MSITLSLPAAIAVVATALLVADDDHDLDITAAARCEALDAEQLTIDLQPAGSLELIYAGDDHVTCNEVIVVTSYASDGPVVDNHHDPVVDQEVIQVAALEAAGATGITVHLELDECWAGLQVHRDGDTLLWEHVEGDGCIDDFTSQPARSRDIRVLDVENSHLQHSDDRQHSDRVSRRPPRSARTTRWRPAPTPRGTHRTASWPGGRATGSGAAGAGSRGR